MDELNGLGTAHGLKARHIVPFAKDIDESLQCVQINDDGSETVISFDTSDGSVMENSDWFVWGFWVSLINL